MSRSYGHFLHSQNKKIATHFPEKDGGGGGGGAKGRQSFLEIHPFLGVEVSLKGEVRQNILNGSKFLFDPN